MNTLESTPQSGGILETLNRRSVRWAIGSMLLPGVAAFALAGCKNIPKETYDNLADGERPYSWGDDKPVTLIKGAMALKGPNDTFRCGTIKKEMKAVPIQEDADHKGKEIRAYQFNKDDLTSLNPNNNCREKVWVQSSNVKDAPPAVSPAPSAPTPSAPAQH